MRRTLMMTAPFWLIALATTAQADSPPAPETATEVTIIATRTEKKIEDAPATVSVITAQQMDDQMVTDIKDLVRFEPGVAVRSAPARFTAAGASTGRDGNSGFNIRGIEGNRVLIQIDGIRVPDAFSFGAQSVGRGGYADLDLLKSVEILRGPASALYGSDGIAGAVSFTTKDPGDILKGGKAFGGQVRVGYSGADDSWSKGLVLAGQADKWSAMLAYTRRDGHEQATRGSNDSANVNRTTADPQDINSNALLAKLIYTPADGHRLRLTYDHYDNVTDTDVLSAIAAPAVAPATLSSTATLGLTAHDTTRRNRASLDYRYRGAGLIDGIDAVAYTQTSRTRQTAAEDRNTAADRTRINVFDTTVTGVNIDFTSHATTGALSHTFTYGGDASVTRQVSLRDGTVPPSGETYPTRAFPTTDFTRTGVFVQDEISLGKLSLYPAIRYDSYDLKPKADALLTSFTASSQHGSHVSPKIALVYKLTPTVGLFVNAAEGYKAPAPGEVNNAFSNLTSFYQSLPNPDLKPETSQTIEGGLRYNTARWSAQVTAFSGQYKNFISQQLVGGNFTAASPALYQYVNLAEVKISGVEARAQADLGQGFALTLAASTTKGTTTTKGVKTDLDTVEPWKAIAGLNYRARNYGGALTLTHSAKKDGAVTGYVPDAFTVADLTAFWNLSDDLTLRAGIFNLGDTKYIWWSDVRGLSAASTVVDAYTQPGRKGSVSLSYRF